MSQSFGARNAIATKTNLLYSINNKKNNKINNNKNNKINNKKNNTKNNNKLACNDKKNNNCITDIGGLEKSVVITGSSSKNSNNRLDWGIKKTALSLWGMSGV